jgi:hypothetical protein
MVDLQPVQSSSIEAVGYDPELGELHVVFRSSPSAYIYQGVPQQVFDALMTSPSAGAFINRQVVNIYPFYRG